MARTARTARLMGALRSKRALAAGVAVAMGLALAACASTSASSTTTTTRAAATAASTTGAALSALPAPAIAGVPPLPGPIAAPARLSTNMANLDVTPDSGVIGSTMTISGSHLAANQHVTLTWSTAKDTWEASVQPDTVNYLGRLETKLAVVIATTTTSASGAFSVTMKAPDDWGGVHDIYAVINGVEVAHGGYLIARSATISPTSGPIGTPITITYRGLGASLYESGFSILYDNHYVGEGMSTWTRGTSQVVIRASGPVGVHTIQIGNAIGYLYLNVPQSPIPFTTGATFSFTVTADDGPPAASIDWPSSVAPTITARTTLAKSGLAVASTAKMTLTQTSGAVNTKVGLTASGLKSSAPVQLVWSTVVGNRVNCASTCWSFVSVPLGTVTPSNGSINTSIKVPDGLGGWHAVQLVQGGEIQAQVPFYVHISIVGKGVGSVVVKEGQSFTIHLEGVGWTQLDNTVAVDYDNSYIGYGCGFNSNGDVLLHIYATGGPGTHLIDLYPMLYTLSPSFANAEYGMVPMLTYAQDAPGLAVGYQSAALRFAITVVK
ncbi:MAG: hypothetical protein ACLQNG_00705 [Acidimicrobiales bacterium]